MPRLLYTSYKLSLKKYAYPLQDGRKEDILNTDTSTQNGGQHEERLAYNRRLYDTWIWPYDRTRLCGRIFYDGVQGEQTGDVYKRQMDRSDARTVPILAMTANAFDEDRMEALDAGMNGYLVKPLDLTMLISALKSLDG